MGFYEAFIECMQNSGVPDVSAVPQDEGALRAAIDGIKGVVGQMDDNAKEMLKELTTNEANNNLFAQAGADTKGLESMFDQAQGWDFEQLLQYCDYCFEQAQQAGGGEQEGSEHSSEEQGYGDQGSGTGGENEQGEGQTEEETY